MRAIPLAALIALAAPACHKVLPPTEILVVVHSDIEATSLRYVRIRVVRPEEKTTTAAPLFGSRCVCIGTGSGCLELPLSLGITPSKMANPAATFTVVAQGYHDNSACENDAALPFVEQSATVQFSAESQLQLDLYLRSDCQDIPPCTPGTTCIDGSPLCESNRRLTLPSFDVDAGPSPVDLGSSPGDATTTSDGTTTVSDLTTPPVDLGPVADLPLPPIDLSTDFPISDMKLPPLLDLSTDFPSLPDMPPPPFDFAINLGDLPDLPDLPDMADMADMADLATFDGPQLALSKFAWYSPLPEGPIIVTLHVDPSNTTGSPFWGVTGGGDAVRYDPGMQLVSAEPTTAAQPLAAVAVRASDVWAGSGNSLLMHRDGAGTWKRHVLQGPPDVNLSVIVPVEGPTAGLFVMVAGNKAMGGLPYSALVDAADPSAATLGQAFITAMLAPRGAYSSSDGTRALMVGADSNNATLGVLTVKSPGSPIFTPVALPANTPGLNAVWGFGNAGSVAVGNNGMTVIFENSSWVQHPVPSYNGPLFNVGSPDDNTSNVYASGGGNKWFRWNGNSWTDVSSALPVTTGLWGVAVSGGLFVAAGANNLWTSSDATTWLPHLAAPTPGTPQWNGKPDGLGTTRVIAPSGTKLLGTLDGSAWSPIVVTSTITDTLNAVFYYPSGNKTFVAGNSGVLLSSQDVFTSFSMETGWSVDTSKNLTGVWADEASGRVFVVGHDKIANRSIAYRNAAGPYALDGTFPTYFPSSRAWAVHGIAANDVYVVGDNGNGGGFIARWDGAIWTDVPVSQGNYRKPLRGVWVDASGEVFAVGDGDQVGTTFYRKPSTKSTFEPYTFNSFPGPVSFYDVRGSATNDVFAVGPRNLMMHWDGATWSFMDTRTDAVLSGVYADPLRVMIGGSEHILDWWR